MATPRRCRGRPEDRRPGVRAGRGRRLRRVLRRAGRRSACRCPRGLSDIEAASLPETFFTVWSNVFDRGRLQPGETLLVQGGTSGIGVTAIQMAKAFGATGVRHRRLRREGRRVPRARRRARHQLPRRRISSPKSSELTGGKGVNVILDMVGGEYFARESSASAEDGRVVVIARAGRRQAHDRRRPGVASPADDHRLDAAAAAGRVQGRDRRRRCSKTVWPWLESGRVKPVHPRGLSRRARPPRAHGLMESSRHIGKLVLAWWARRAADWSSATGR